MNADDTQTILPLTGIKVLDLSRVHAGPWCTMNLADLGADVIKVENPQGGHTRTWKPPSSTGESAYYQCANRSKRSIIADLQRPEDQDIVRALASGAMSCSRISGRCAGQVWPRIPVSPGNQSEAHLSLDHRLRASASAPFRSGL